MDDIDYGALADTVDVHPDIARAVVAALRRQGFSVVPMERVKPETQADWLVAWAKDHGGIVEIAAAKKALVAQGRTSAKPINLYNNLKNLMERTGEYERVGPGMFRWIPYFGSDEEPNTCAGHS